MRFRVPDGRAHILRILFSFGEEWRIMRIDCRLLMGARTQKEQDMEEVLGIFWG